MYLYNAQLTSVQPKTMQISDKEMEVGEEPQQGESNGNTTN